MVASGHCGPHCDRLQFRYAHGEGYIRPFAELPFIYNCNNTNAYRACYCRYLKSLETADQAAAAKLVAREAERRRKAAREMIQRAEASVARALYEMHEGVWFQLSRYFVEMEEIRKKGGQSVADSMAQIAAHLVGGKELMKFVDWESESAIERFEDALGVGLQRMGVGLLPGMDDLIGKLERIKEFLLDENGLPRPGLTEEQIRGNMANLERIAGQVQQVIGGAEQDRERLLGWIEELQALFPGK